jgi:hypothetical protein
MGYTFVCEDCGRGYNHEPPLMGSFTDTFIKTSDSWLAQEYRPGETVTFCRSCAEDIIT